MSTESIFPIAEKLYKCLFSQMNVKIKLSLSVFPVPKIVLAEK